ncbi:glycosyl transferase family 4-domain-containing protein [Dipodascopsis uninucleata]
MSELEAKDSTQEVNAETISLIRDKLPKHVISKLSLGTIIFRLFLTGLGLALVFNSSSNPLLSSAGFSVLAYVLTAILIPILGPEFIRVGFYGKDLGKLDRPVIPETMGAVCAVVYLSIMFLFIPFLFYKYLVVQTSGAGNRDEVFDASLLHTGRRLPLFPHSKLAEYLAALLSLFSMLVLGVADDLFDIKWRNKLFLPALGVIPLLVVYYVDFGVTDVAVPQFMGSILKSVGFSSQYSLPNVINLGGLYYLYMIMVAIFCPNSINILAGVNGLEAGQSLVIGVFLLLNDLIYIGPGYIFGTSSPHPATEAHLFSTYFILPFIAVTVALLGHNWYPATAFVGDTFCYFAGMIFALVGILGHFSKTLILFLIPQVFNAIYSAPQLFHFIPCPRHRLPRFNAEDGLMYPSRVVFDKKRPNILQSLFLRTLSIFGLVHLEYDEEKKHIKSASNLTLINLVLTWTGPMREDNVTIFILFIQTLCCSFGLLFRYTLAFYLFGRDNI